MNITAIDLLKLLRSIDSIFSNFDENNIYKSSTLIDLTLSKTTMKSLLLSLAILTSLFGTIQPAQAEIGRNDIGPSIIFGSGDTSLGVAAHLGISDNLSLRPNIYFEPSATVFGTAVTYDFQAIDTERKLTPYAGLGVRFNSGNNNVTTAYFTGGADYNLDGSIVLKGNLSIPFSSNGASTTVGLGAGLSF